MLLTAPGLRDTVRRSLLDPGNIEINTGIRHTAQDMDALHRTAGYIKTELNRISQFFEGQNVMESRTLRTIRRLFNRFYRTVNGHEEEDFEMNQVDPFDVLSLLSQMFILPYTATTDKGPSMFHDIIKIRAPFKDGVRTSKYVPQYVYDDANDPDERESHDDDRQILDASELLLSVERGKVITKSYGKKEAKTVKVLDAVVPDQALSLKGSGDELKLSAIIIHLSSGYSNGHYTLMIRYGDAWYYYDDLAGPLFKCIGSYDDMINYSIKKGSTTRYANIALKYSKAILYTRD